MLRHDTMCACSAAYSGYPYKLCHINRRRQSASSPNTLETRNSTSNSWRTGWANLWAQFLQSLRFHESQ